jgi:hypothetical protein
MYLLVLAHLAPPRRALTAGPAPNTHAQGKDKNEVIAAIAANKIVFDPDFEVPSAAQSVCARAARRSRSNECGR